MPQAGNAYNAPKRFGSRGRAKRRLGVQSGFQTPRIAFYYSPDAQDGPKPATSPPTFKIPYPERRTGRQNRSAEQSPSLPCRTLPRAFCAFLLRLDAMPDGLPWLKPWGAGGGRGRREFDRTGGRRWPFKPPGFYNRSTTAGGVGEG
jgi:hypothetical protein